MFIDLCEAVSALHQEDMIHRALTPNAVRAGDELISLSVDDFGMSALVRALARSGLTREPPDLPSDPLSHAFLAPERLDVLFGSPSTSIEGFACDVFGLGLFGALLFGVPLTDATGIIEGAKYHSNRHREWIDATRSAVNSSSLPRELIRLLSQMLDYWPSGRPASAIDVFATVLRLREGLAAQFDHGSKSPISRPHKVRFLAETIIRLHREGLARSTPEDPDYEEYADIISRDLEHGQLVWSPNGYLTWDSSSGKGRPEDAKIVLVGRLFSYFSEYLDASQGKSNEQALQVKYLTYTSQLRSLANAPRRRNISSVEALYYDPRSQGRLPPRADDPSWKELVDDVRDDRTTLASPVVEAARWLLARHKADDLAQEYRFKRIDPQGMVLQESENAATTISRDENAQRFITLLDQEHLVLPMAKCFESIHERAIEEGEQAEFEVLDHQGKLTPFRLRYEATIDDRTVRFESFEGAAQLPPEGIIRPDPKRNSLVQARQERAVEELSRRTSLAAQLESPRGALLHRGRPVTQQLGRLDPETRALVGRMLDEEPLFVLQGPPGTGKTFVASQVVAEFLEREPHARILVSAQSNAALDKLLEDVVEEFRVRALDRRYIVLRHASEHAARKVSPAADPYLLDNSVMRLRDELQKSRAPSADAGALKLRQELLQLARQKQLDVELRESIHRAANVIAATTAGAGAPVVVGSGGFDLVVIEEAARAWLTEVLVPMVQGERWILVGDHKQLPPHGLREVEATFTRDVVHRITASPPSRSMQPYLRHFQHLMESPKPTRRNEVDPRHRISIQRRMHPEIGEVVSRAFYDGDLKPHPSTHRLHRIRVPLLRDRTLVWIDTTSGSERAWEAPPRWTNETELRLIKEFFRVIGDVPAHADGVQDVAVYSPYRKMVDFIEKKGNLPSGGLTATVDAVQGRQAEVVIVSLVRNNAVEGSRGGLGFLADPERINVLMSRARRMLVLIGAIGHFSRFNVPHWRAIVDYINEDRDRRVIDARGLVANLGRVSR
ncbi:MAG TPA: AAA domain-containing protein [Sorangium sp.]|nr:AAA domain-containing protein [Sorangium sp.]